jgi:hypothetical protein
MTQPMTLLKRVTIEYYEDIRGGDANTPEVIRHINKKTKTESFGGGSSRGEPIITYRSEIL